MTWWHDVECSRAHVFVTPLSSHNSKGHWNCWTGFGCCCFPSWKHWDWWESWQLTWRSQLGPLPTVKRCCEFFKAKKAIWTFLTTRTSVDTIESFFFRGLRGYVKGQVGIDLFDWPWLVFAPVASTQAQRKPQPGRKAQSSKPLYMAPMKGLPGHIGHITCQNLALPKLQYSPTNRLKGYKSLPGWLQHMFESQEKLGGNPTSNPWYIAGDLRKHQLFWPSLRRVLQKKVVDLQTSLQKNHKPGEKVWRHGFLAQSFKKKTVLLVVLWVATTGMFDQLWQLCLPFDGGFFGGWKTLPKTLQIHQRMLIYFYASASAFWMNLLKALVASIHICNRQFSYLF